MTKPVSPWRGEEYADNRVTCSNVSHPPFFFGMGGSFFLNSLGSVAGGQRGNGGKEQTAAHQHKEEQTAKAIHGDSVFHKVRQATVQAAFPEERARRDIRMLPNRKTSGDDFAFTCILKYIQGQHMSGKPFTANQGQELPASVVSMKRAMSDSAMNVSILEGYPLSAQSFRGTPFSA